MRPGQQSANHLLNDGILAEGDAVDKLRKMIRSNFFYSMVDRMIALEPKFKRIVDRIKPDITVVDNFVGTPSLVHSGRPWVFLWSGNPLACFKDDQRLPPPCLGKIQEYCSAIA